MIKFAFYGRVSTEDQQDPAASYNWQRSRADALMSGHTNPRYTGRQVWNKQRKTEVLLDLGNVAEGYETKQKWNKPGDWVWSEQVVHEPLVSVEDFEAVQARIASRAHQGPRLPRENLTTKRTYLLRGLLHCGLCGRKMQASTAHGTIYYRCLYPEQYALANHIHHPRGIFLREDVVVPRIDAWLAKAFAPHRLAETVAAMAATSAQDDNEVIAETVDSQQLAACERKLAQYRALLEQGTDPAIVAKWIGEVEAERTRLQAAARTVPADAPVSEEELSALVNALGDIVKVIAEAAPADKTELYKKLGLRLEYDINANAVNAAVMATDGTPWDPSVDERLRNYGVRGGT
jgi:hypothetical protein